jgi:GT-D fold-like domain
MDGDGLSLASEAFDRLFVGDEVVRAAGARCAFFEPDGQKAALALLERLKRALRLGTPLSLVRVGNGEGNAVSMLDRPVAEAVYQGFDFEFVSQNGLPIGVEEAVRFSARVVEAITSADIQGYRIGRFDEAALIRACMARGELSPTFGLIHARRLFYDQLRESPGTWFTNAWIHLDLIGHIEALLDCASRVLVVTGRPELEGLFRDRLGPRLTRFVPVPVQGHVPRAPSDCHFERFEEVRARLRGEDLSGALVLVGAGLFGKIYCRDARDSGAVAVDLGSAFDLLAGVSTRPVHRQIDLAAVRWLDRGG